MWLFSYGNACVTWLYVPVVVVTFIVACAPLIMVTPEFVGAVAVSAAVLPELIVPVPALMVICVPFT